MNRVTAATLLVAACILTVNFLSQRPSHQNPGVPPTKTDPLGTAVQTSAGASTAPPKPGHSAAENPEATAAKRLHRALAALKSAANADEARKILADLRSHLDSLPPDLPAAVITGFLADPANNAPTHIDFAIGRTGFLDGHPSLRVALLDWLGQIDPRQAGLVAAQVLAAPTDADEWAVSLRNYARANPSADSQAFLRSKTEELIRNSNWRMNPSIGFFESFDVLVHTRSTGSTRLLSDLAADRSPQGKPLAHAAFLTLDRLTIREPAAMMEQLAVRHELTKSRGEMVANFFARADLRDPTQQKLVRSYLLDPARTAAELNTFSGVNPNASFTISENLLSENVTLTRNEITARDSAALDIVNTWLADPSFAPLKSQLATIQRRLETFVRQANE